MSKFCGDAVQAACAYHAVQLDDIDALRIRVARRAGVLFDFEAGKLIGGHRAAQLRERDEVRLRLHVVLRT